MDSLTSPHPFPSHGFSDHNLQSNTDMASSTSENAPNIKQFEDEWNSDEMTAKWKLAEAGTKPWASIMIQQSGIISSNEDAYALDLACGTGVVTATIYEMLPRDDWSRVKVMGSDVSESMVSSLAKRAEAAKWPAVETKVTSGIVRTFNCPISSRHRTAPLVTYLAT